MANNQSRILEPDEQDAALAALQKRYDEESTAAVLARNGVVADTPNTAVDQKAKNYKITTSSAPPTIKTEHNQAGSPFARATLPVKQEVLSPAATVAPVVDKLNQHYRAKEAGIKEGVDTAGTVNDYADIAKDAAEKVGKNVMYYGTRINNIAWVRKIGRATGWVLDKFAIGADVADKGVKVAEVAELKAKESPQLAQRMAEILGEEAAGKAIDSVKTMGVPGYVVGVGSKLIGLDQKAGEKIGKRIQTVQQYSEKLKPKRAAFIAMARSKGFKGTDNEVVRGYQLQLRKKYPDYANPKGKVYITIDDVFTDPSAEDEYVIPKGE